VTHAIPGEDGGIEGNRSHRQRAAVTSMDLMHVASYIVYNRCQDVIHNVTICECLGLETGLSLELGIAIVVCIFFQNVMSHLATLLEM
jgi:hypothetical protein